jgi:hypothetical protein
MERVADKFSRQELDPEGYPQKITGTIRDRYPANGEAL